MAPLAKVTAAGKKPLPPPALSVTVGCETYPVPPVKTSTRSTMPLAAVSVVDPAVPLTATGADVHVPERFAGFDASYHQVSDDPNCVGAHSGVALTVLDAGPAPRTLLAATVKEYVVPFVRPDTVHDVAGAVARQLAPPGEAVTV